MSTKNIPPSKAAIRMTEIILDALNEFPPAERANRLKEYKAHLSSGISVRSSSHSDPSTRNGSQHT